VQFVAGLLRGNNELFPVVVELLDLVVFVLVELALLVLLLEQRVHFVDGLELHLEVRLLLADLL